MGQGWEGLVRRLSDPARRAMMREKKVLINLTEPGECLGLPDGSFPE